jgi:predicted acylesterase/phospholipase RssA
MSDALILAGGVAKGAFASGALAELLEPAMQARLGLDVRRVVATSSGAVNGAFVASHLRAGSEAAAMPLLEELWVEFGDFRDVFDPSFSALTRGRGISTGQKVRALLERFVTPQGGSRPIELAVVVANLNGEVDSVGSELATTYERCLRFSGAAFDSPDGLSPLFDAVVASSAFPVVFEPARLTIDSREVRCVDGGVCNNTPIKYALGDGGDVERIFVIAPYPSVQANVPDLHGAALLSHLGDMLVQERLFRDLREAHEVNRALRALERAMLLPSLRERALAAIGWSGRRVIEIVEVRPPVALEGEAFAGFFSRRLREDYVRSGHAAMRSAVGSA